MSYGGFGGGYGGGGGGSYGGGGMGGGAFGGGGGHFGSSQGRDLDSIQLRKEDFRGLPPFEKNFYHEHPAVTARSDTEIAAYRARREIHIEGHDVPKPVTTFEEASFPGKLILLLAETNTGRHQSQVLCLSCRVRFDRSQQSWFHRANSYPMSRLAHGAVGTRLDWFGRDRFWQDTGILASCSGSHQCTAISR